METFKSINSKEYVEELKQKVAEAYQAGLRMDDYDNKIQELRLLRQQERAGLNPTQLRRFNDLKEEINKIEVLVSSVMEYKKVLEMIGLPKHQVDSLLNHENAHANVAEQVPSQSFEGFRVRFHKDRNGNMAMSPSAKTMMDFSFPEEQRLREDILVVEAPLHYGDKLSSGDMAILKENRDKLSRL